MLYLWDSQRTDQQVRGVAVRARGGYGITEYTTNERPQQICCFQPTPTLMLAQFMQNLMRRDVGDGSPAEFRTEQLHEPVHFFERRRGKTFAGFLLNQIVGYMRETVASAYARLNSRLPLGEVWIDRMRYLLAGGVTCLPGLGQTDFGIRSERQFSLHTVDSIFHPPQLATARIDLQVKTF